MDDLLTTTNYTTGKLFVAMAQMCTQVLLHHHFTLPCVFFLLIVASAAAEATGSEETAADCSAMESFGPNDDQQVYITFNL
jgi:hypothetical protein